MNIGKVIKTYREGAGETQRAFAAKLGITPSSLCKIEAAKRAPKQKTIETFLAISGYPLARLYIEALEPSDF